MHLDPLPLGIVESVMLESREIEITPELAVDARQQIEVELRGDAGRVVVRGIQDLRLLLQIDANDQNAGRPENSAGMPQEGVGLVRLEIADRRAREKTHMGQARNSCRQVERFGKVRADRQHVQARKIGAQGGCFLLQHLRRNIDRHIGREPQRGAEQDADLCGRAATELDQTGAPRNELGNFLRVVA